MAAAAATKALQEGPSKLSQIVQHLSQKPHLHLFDVANITVRFEAKRNSPGTKYFVKDALPRLRWANPEMDIAVDKVWRPAEPVQPSIKLTYTTGTTRSFKMDKKWSTTILREIMDAAGGDPWQQYKQQRIEEGLPLLPGDDKGARIEAQWKRQTVTPRESEETDL